MCVCRVQTKGALAAAAAASAVAAQVARGRGRAALARGAFVSAAAPGYVTPGNDGTRPRRASVTCLCSVGACLLHSSDIFWESQASSCPLQLNWKYHIIIITSSPGDRLPSARDSLRAQFLNRGHGSLDVCGPAVVVCLVRQDCSVLSGLNPQLSVRAQRCQNSPKLTGVQPRMKQACH